MNKRKLGADKEELAVKKLEEMGYQILTRNYWCPFAELDIVGKDEEYLCFIEVKFRKNEVYGGSEGTISPKKIRNICQCARYYMAKENVLADTPIRFDVVFIIGDKIEVIQNAFDYQ